MTKRQWTVREFGPADTSGVVKLWAAVAGFDGSVPARSIAEVAARLEHPAHDGGAHWRVAVAGNGAVVGALEVGLIGTLRTELLLAVNPAWRRQGIGRALLRAAPAKRRLLMSTRGSVPGARELLESEGFKERYREARMRRPAKGIKRMEVPEGARVVIDNNASVGRCLAALAAVFGDDGEQDEGVVKAWLARPGCKALYLDVAGRDYGICMIAASERAKKNEHNADGTPKIGVVERVGLSKALRGKGMSRPLVRAGLVELAKSGFTELEVLADRRRESAVELYEAEGFVVVDEEIHWMKKESHLKA